MPSPAMVCAWRSNRPRRLPPPWLPATCVPTKRLIAHWRDVRCAWAIYCCGWAAIRSFAVAPFAPCRAGPICSSACWQPMLERRILQKFCRLARSSAGACCIVERKKANMKAWGWRFTTLAALATLACALLLPAARTPAQPQATEAIASEIVLTVNPAQSTVHWSVDSSLHLVHGTFAVKSGSVHFDPQTGRAGGEIVVFATSGESGNDSRDARMHKEILETAKYPDAVFRPT